MRTRTRSAVYVIQVAGGAEKRALELIECMLPDLAADCFTPTVEVAQKRAGQWRRVRRLLFPGYLFIQTNDPVGLNARLRGIPAFTRLLGGNDDKFVPLTTDELAWLDAFTDGPDHIVHMSEAVIEGDQVLVTRGPLKGHEFQIVRVDRHKRTATLQVTMCGQTKPVKVGLEVVRKKPSSGTKGPVPEVP